MTDLVNTQRLISDLVNETLARERAELADLLGTLADLPDIDLDVLVAAYWQKPDLADLAPDFDFDFDFDFKGFNFDFDFDFDFKGFDFDFDFSGLLEAIRESRD